MTEVPSAVGRRGRARRGRVRRPPGAGRSRIGPGGGSIIVILATDAPLLPHQCERLAQRASLGLARMGSYRVAMARATCSSRSRPATAGWSRPASERDPRRTVETRMVVDRAISPLFQATVEAVEAAVVNALLARRDA